MTLYDETTQLLNDIWSCEAKFVADYWLDDYIDNGVTLTNPYISGY